MPQPTTVSNTMPVTSLFSRKNFMILFSMDHSMFETTRIELSFEAKSDRPQKHSLQCLLTEGQQNIE